MGRTLTAYAPKPACQRVTSYTAPRLSGTRRLAEVVWKCASQLGALSLVLSVLLLGLHLVVLVYTSLPGFVLGLGTMTL